MDARLRGPALALLAALLLGSGTAGAAGPPPVCLEDGLSGMPMPWADYTGAGATLAPHCFGTNHQTVSGLQRVVFLGDSITVGTPPTLVDDLYRNRLADDLVDTFGLNDPSPLWRIVDPFDGTSGTEESGDFASCARWGAKTDDLLGGDQQLLDCFSGGDFGKRTLVVLTVGGNDVISLADDAAGGATPAQLEASRDAFVAELELAIEWLLEPGRFSNGIFVVFANVYDPTDGLGSVPGICAGLYPSLTPVADLVIEAHEAYLGIAVEHGVDLVFSRERFCGHGLNVGEDAGTCYRGSGTEEWIDETCIHPDHDGHAALAADFLATILAVAPAQGIPTFGPAGLAVLAGLLAAALAAQSARRGGC